MHKNEIGGIGAVQYEGGMSSIICIGSTPAHRMNNILILEDKKVTGGEEPPGGGHVMLNFNI